MYEERSEYFKGWQDYLDLFLRRYKLMAIPAVIISAISVVTAYVLPPVYESTAIILIEEPEVPPDLIQSTVTSYADQRLQVIKHRVATTQNATEIIERYNLYPELRRSRPLNRLVENFRDDIEMETISARIVNPQSGRAMMATIAFELSYRSRNPRAAQQVTNELVTFYLSENVRERQDQASETTRFLAQESARLAARIQDLEANLAKFKVENAGRLPDQLNASLSILDRTEAEILNVDRRIQAIDDQRSFLQGQLATADPYLGSNADGDAALSPEQRLSELRREYTQLQSLYGSQHPDVVQARREIEVLRRQTASTNDAESVLAELQIARTQLAEALERYSPEHPEVKSAQRLIEQLTVDLAWVQNNPPKEKTGAGATNPRYIQLRTQINALNTERRSLVAQRASLQTKREEYDARVLAIPETEREYRNLVRDYENAQKKYSETKDKQLQAELSQSLETERMSERFSLIEPPPLPDRPIKPKRLVIVGVGFMLALAVGMGLVLLVDFIDDGIYGARQLAGITGQAPLVTIPRLVTSADRNWAFAKALIWISGIGTSAGLALATAHLYIMPLDNLWFVILRRLGV